MYISSSSFAFWTAVTKFIWWRTNNPFSWSPCIQASHRSLYDASKSAKTR